VDIKKAVDAWLAYVGSLQAACAVNGGG